MMTMMPSSVRAGIAGVVCSLAIVSIVAISVKSSTPTSAPVPTPFPQPDLLIPEKSAATYSVPTAFADNAEGMSFSARITVRDLSKQAVTPFLSKGDPRTYTVGRYNPAVGERMSMDGPDRFLSCPLIAFEGASTLVVKFTSVYRLTERVSFPLRDASAVIPGRRCFVTVVLAQDGEGVDVTAYVNSVVAGTERVDGAALRPTDGRVNVFQSPAIRVGDVNFFNRALGAAEVSTLVESGRA